MAFLPLLVLSAGLRAAALPGWYWGPLVFLAVAARVAWWERGGRARGDYLGGVLYWLLAFSFLVHTSPERIWGFGAAAGTAAVLGLVWVLEGFVYRRLRRRLPAALAATLALVAVEWLRAVWTPFGVGGMPWASLGLTLAPTPLLPLASLAGEHGLTLLAAAGGGWLYAAVAGGPGGRLRTAAGALLAIVVAGAWMIPAIPEQGAVRCLAVQPRVRLSEKHGGWSSGELYADQAELTQGAFDAGVEPELVLWAETMWPYPGVDQRVYGLNQWMRRPWPDQPHEERRMGRLLEEQQKHVRELLAGAANRPHFLTGAHFYAPVEIADGPDAMSPRTTDFLLFDADGDLIAHFPKQELVPFGEQLPYHGRFPGADAFIDWVWRNYGLRPDFDQPAGGGPLPASERLPALGGAVCWENVFERPFRAQALAGARAFCILSNEDWFGVGGAEMAQMVAATQLRSVETGRAALRVTNTGDTVLVRPSGEVVREGPRGAAPAPGERGWWDVDLPLVDATARTPYLRGGWLVAPLLAALAGLLVLLPPWRRRLDPSPGEG